MKNQLIKRSALSLVIAGLSGAAIPAMVWAEENSNDGMVLEEVMVTAQKREQSLSDVPSAVTPISGEYVQEMISAGENIRALAGRVPSLQIESSNGRQSPRFYIRGLGNYDFDVNATQPVALIYDDVALENSVLKSIPLFDVEQVEVLKGPQGTLFGRSTTAGVIKVDSVKPSQVEEGYGRLGYGSHNTQTFEGAYGTGLSDTMAARAAVKYQKRDAWIDNENAGTRGDDFGDFDELAYRLQFLAEPSADLSILTKLHGFHQNGGQPQVFYANAFTPGHEGLRPGFDINSAAHDYTDSGFEMDHTGGSIKVGYDISSSLAVTSVTSYDTVSSFSSADIDGGVQGGPEAIGQPNQQAFFSVASGDGLDDHYQFTQELRLAGNDDNLFYQGGLYYFQEDITVRSVDFDNAGTATNMTFVEQLTTSAAAFGQAEYGITDALSVTGGLRYTMDTKELDVRPGTPSAAAAASIEDDDRYFSWELAGNYDLNDDWTVYSRLATASRGPATLGRFGVTTKADTETITSFETGFKSLLFDNRAHWNTTAYYYTIKDHQLTATGGSDNVNRLLNADKTLGYGVETDLTAQLTDQLRLTFNMSYNRTEIQDASLTTDLCSGTPGCTSADPFVATVPGAFGDRTLVSIDGNPVPRSPEWLTNIILSYRYPVASGSLNASTDWNYRSESNIFLYESTEFVAESRWIGGVKLGYENYASAYDISLVGRNITNRIVADGAIDFLNMTAFTNEPRYYGIEASKYF
ncbi:MAG: TonB-dependent receptor [Saccharospirillaceae bacterium]|nr:TonB-dependent receptor [Saccharospirillaceae bacterium]MCD8532438.1 TonB-dependent receptor [Saccharospirillaceae bacterium]